MDDIWLDYFPEYAKDASEAFHHITLRQILTMSIGQDAEPIVREGDDWFYNTVTKESAFLPGEKFFYNTFATCLLSPLAEKLTGKKLADLAEERLFRPLGITEYEWDEDESGHSIGGFGLHLKTEDLAKFGECIRNHGRYQGRQVLPEDYLAMATSRQIETKDGYGAEREENRQGYGFQFWMCTDNAFRCSGLHGQICYIHPENRLVIAMNCATSGSQAILDSWYRSQQQKDEGSVQLNLPYASGVSCTCALPNSLMNRKWAAEKNPYGVTSFSFRQTEDCCLEIAIGKGGREYRFSSGYSCWKESDCDFSDFSEFFWNPGMKKEKLDFRESCLYSNYAWETPTMLHIQVRQKNHAAKWEFYLQVDHVYLDLIYHTEALYTQEESWQVFFRVDEK